MCVVLSIRSIVNEQVLQLAEETAKHVMFSAALEDTPYTSNIAYLNSARDQALASLKRRYEPEEGESVGTRAPNVRDGPSTAQHGTAPISMETVMAGLVYWLEPGITQADLSKLKKSPFELELNLMAQTDAYWSVAYKVSQFIPWLARPPG